MPEASRSIRVDGDATDIAAYRRMHDGRIHRTIALMHDTQCRRIVELGAHPWVMTAALLDDGAFEVLATISAEETLRWPDDPDVTETHHEIVSPAGNRSNVKNYAFNIERRLIRIEERPDAILACEIIEHLIRSPHIMLLNANRWLDVGGAMILTTPNGSQFMNPLRLAPRMPAYRAHCYERHVYVYRLTDLVDIVELCGFRVERAGYWSPYPAGGSQKVYKFLARLPGSYCAEKFHRTIFLVARKQRDVHTLERTPRVYVPSPHWEHVSTASSPSRPATAPPDVLE